MSSIADLFLKVIADLTGFEADVTKGATKAGQTGGKALGASITKHTTAAFTAAGAAGGAVFTGAIGGAANFEDQLRTINTVAHLTDDQLKTAGQSILDLSKETGNSTDDLTAGFYDLVSAGIPAEKAISVLKDSAVLAKGALGTTAETVDLVTSALNAYGLKADQSTKITDIFAQAVADGKVTASEIGTSLANIAPIASSAGISLEEVGASYAVLTAKGVPAAQAATQMRAAISALLTPNLALNAIQAKTGKNFAELAKAKGLAVALDELSKATGGNAEEMAKALGSVEAYQFSLAVTGDGASAFATELGKVTTASKDGGVAQGQYEERMKSAKSQSDKFIAGLRATAIELGGPFVDSLGGAVLSLNELGGGMGGLVNLTRLFGGAIGAVAGNVVGRVGPKFVGLGKSLGTKVASGIANSSLVTGASKFGTQMGTKIAAGLASSSLVQGAQKLGTTLGLKIAAGIAGSSVITAMSAGLSGMFTAAGNSSLVTGASEKIGTTLGGKFGIAFKLAAVLGIAAIASEIAGPLQDIGKDIHEAILGKGSNPLSDFGKAWQDWRKNTPWPLGQKDAPDWASLGGEVDDGLDTALVDPMDRAADNASAAAAKIVPAVADSITSGKPLLAGIGKDLIPTFGSDVAAGIAAGKPIIAGALKDILPPFGSDLAAKGHTAGASLSRSIAEGVKSARDLVAGAMGILDDALKVEMSPAKERANLLGQLTGKELAHGLKSKDPIVKQAAEDAKNTILHRLEQLVPANGKLGKKSAAELAKALKSKNPEVRAAAQKLKGTIEERLNAVKATKAGKAKGKEVAEGIRAEKGAVGRAALSLANKVADTIVSRIKHYQGGGSGGKQARASGGPVTAGTPYLVNENTPRSETFVPAVSGYVLTRADAMAAVERASGHSDHGTVVNLNTYGLPMYARTPVEVGRQVRRAIKAGTPMPPPRRASWSPS